MTPDSAPAFRATPGAIVAALLLPPLGVFLAEGIRPAFWLDVLLTFLFFLPGVVFALFMVLRPRLA